MPWSTLAGAGPWAAFLGLCMVLVFLLITDRLISGKRYDRREREWKQRYERDIAAEQRIAAIAEKARDQAVEARDRESARADRATAGLATLSAQLPEALRQAKVGPT